jgi:hypothetical protein
MRILMNPLLFRIPLQLALTFGAVGGSLQGGNPTKLSGGLLKACIIIFIVLTVLLAVQVLFLARQEAGRRASTNSSPLSFLNYLSL